MSSDKMDKVFNPQDFEERIYKQWMDNGCFKPAGDKSKDPFVIVIPPPNVTGVLHMGHGLNDSLQDILIRYYRMKGRPTLWVPGTDHAGIATQHVVEKRLLAKGLSRKKLGREEFVKETWRVKEEHHSIISKQLRKIGASCDWSRERFTLDEGLSDAVREVFVNLYEKDLIYKGSYLVNWCSSCGTAIADDEVDHEEVNGAMYRFRYPFAEGEGFIEIATTRPETMFGDTAVAVNPEDDRYKNLIGKELLLPLTNRRIPIIADSYVDKEFGSGAVKITPAHDPNDWEIGNRHQLEKINILNPDGTLNSNCPEFVQSMSVEEARKATIAKLEEEGFYIGKDDRVHQVGHCYRCSTVIEPYMSPQWFVRMKPLADKALKAWKDGEVVFHPKKWENTYSHWLENIRDWCISRQLWWGHRIPVWYCKDCGELIVKRTDPESCEKCGSKNLRQDEDVLDTWFSSWLWPFSTLGWPEQSSDLAQFYPTSSLVTAYDIIFFWVARMIMAGIEFTGQVPFKDVYIHQLIRDKQGRKMSKSLGNGIDPLDVVAEHGADSLKFTLAFMAAQGQDILIDQDTFKLGSKFANKVWNASRYILMNIDGELPSVDCVQLNSVDKWIYHRLNAVAGEVDKALKAYKFNDAAHQLYEFFWNDFCDWYIEASKVELYSGQSDKKLRAQVLLVDVLKESLKLLHPFLSFITEEIYSKIPGTNGFLITAEMPEFNEDRVDQVAADSFDQLQQLVRGVRTLRSEFTIPPEKKVRVSVKCAADFQQFSFFEENVELISSLINGELAFYSNQDFNSEGSVAIASVGFETFVFIRDVVDLEKEKEKLQKELTQLNKLLNATKGKLRNENFLSRAPEEVIKKENSKLNEFSSRISKIETYLKEL